MDSCIPKEEEEEEEEKKLDFTMDEIEEGNNR
jgi:hypothetical protein